MQFQVAKQKPAFWDSEDLYELFRDLYDHAPNAYISIDGNGVVQMCNTQAEMLLGCTLNDILGKPVLSFYAETPDGKGKAIRIFRRSQRGESIIDEELQMQRADGTVIWVSLTVNSQRDDQGQLISCRTSMVDISKRKWLEAAQKCLSQDLHDTVAGTLYGLVAMANIGQTMVENSSPEQTEKAFHRLASIGKQAVRELRMFLYQMRPSVLTEDGLKNAIEHRLASVEGRSHADIQMQFDETIKLSPHIEEALYFITQEALNNAVKHSQADAIEVSLAQVNGKKQLEIADNGRGFDIADTREIGMGLGNMRARAKGITGQLKISSKEGEGTRVQVVF